MTLFERVEKKIFFRIVRSITFFVAFMALIATIAGLYTSINTSMDAEVKSVQVAKEEIEEVLKPEANRAVHDANSTVAVEEDPEQAELKKLAESIAKKALASQDVLIGNEGYNENLGKMTDVLLNSVAEYDHDTKIDALTQLDELSKTFVKDKYLERIDIFLTLFKSKYAHEQALADQKNLADQANKMMGYSAVGAGIVIFALFVMILVLLRIEKNTRPADSENDEYDTTDKKLLIGIIGVAIAFAILIGWGVNQSFSNDDEFDPVAELRPSYAGNTAPVAEEAAAPVATETYQADAAAPAVDSEEPVEEEYAPSAETTQNY